VYSFRTIAYLGPEENGNSMIAFMPTILKAMGFTATQAQIHAIPIFCTAFVTSITFCYFSEKYQKRYIFILFGALIATVGLSIEIVYPNNAKLLYAGVFLLATGSYTMMPIVTVWFAINTAKGFRRSVGLASVVSLGNCGALVSSNVFYPKDSPKYHRGFSVGLAFIWMAVAASTIMFVGFVIENRRRDRRFPEQDVVYEETPGEPLEKNPNFRYQI
jgi:MFS transporter, ACS family, DAL5 transporter family protein